MGFRAADAGPVIRVKKDRQRSDVSQPGFERRIGQTMKEHEIGRPSRELGKGRLVSDEVHRHALRKKALGTCGRLELEPDTKVMTPRRERGDHLFKVGLDSASPVNMTRRDGDSHRAATPSRDGVVARTGRSVIRAIACCTSNTWW